MNALISQKNRLEAFGTEDISHCRTLLQKLVNNWHKRAQVGQIRQKAVKLNQPEWSFDKDRDDFRVDLLPFKNHPHFQQAPVEVKKKILSCGWLAYSEKTVEIESKIIAPACNYIIGRDVPGVEDGISQQIASDTMVDEAYHVQLVVTACRVTREKRNLQKLRLPNFALTTNMYREQSYFSEPWQKILIQIATAIVSEIFISDYLDLLAHDRKIQPLNQLTVATHRQDEMAHGSIFKYLTKCIYNQLNEKQKEFFIDVLPKPVRWFANTELNVWQSMLQQIGFSHTESVINDCGAINEVNLKSIDYSDLISLAEEIGILDSTLGIDSFSREGILA